MIRPNQIEGYWPNVRAVASSPVTLSSPPATVDDYVLQVEDLVLVTAQADATKNGIYRYTGSALSRPTNPENLAVGALAPLGIVVWCTDGTVNGNSQWVLSASSNVAADGYRWQYARVATDEMVFRRLDRFGGYEHTQNSPATDWTIAHNLGYRPVVEVRTSGGVVRQAGIQHLSENVVTISFLTAATGTARLT